jgi:hypothetical protein
MSLRSTGARWLGVLLSILVLACGDDDGSDAQDGQDGGGAGASASATPCEAGCEATLRADCTMGPSSRQVCEDDCEMLRSGPCGSEYRALMSCGEGEDVSCSDEGLPVVEACSAEQGAFVACLSPGRPVRR